MCHQCSHVKSSYDIYRVVHTLHCHPGANFIRLPESNERMVYFYNPRTGMLKLYTRSNKCISKYWWFELVRTSDSLTTFGHVIRGLDAAFTFGREKK